MKEETRRAWKTIRAWKN